MRTTIAASSRTHRPAAREKTNAGPYRPEESVGYRLKLALYAWTRHLDAALRPLGVTHLQFLVLDYIALCHQHGEIPSQVRIAALMQLDPMMISKILRLLEARGHVRRSPHPDDPRANALYLTATGSALVQAGSPIARAAHAAFFDRRLDAAGKQTLAALLDRLLAPAAAAH